MFSIDQVSRIENEVFEVLKKERERYSKVYIAIENYLSQNKENDKNCIYLGGSMGVNLLFKRSRSLDDFTYTIYSENAFKHANDLTNVIAKLQNDQTGGWIVILLTKIPYKIYEIQVDNRTVVTIINIKNNIQAPPSYHLINPIIEKSYENYNVSILSPEVFLINTYKVLCSPNRVGDWEQALRDETKLFQLLKMRINKSEMDAKISDYTSEHHSSPVLGSKESKDFQIQTAIEQLLLKKVVNQNKNVILIGEHALRLLNDHEKFMDNFSLSSKVVQVIANENIIEEVINVCKKDFPDFKITHHKKQVPILDDFRLVRTIIKIENSEISKEIMYIYNSCDYDLIPYNTIVAPHPKEKDKINIGSPFVLMRYLLIDIWIIRFILGMKMIDENFAKKRIENIKNLFILLRGKIQDKRIDVSIKSLTSEDKIEGVKIGHLTTNINDDYFARGLLGVLDNDYHGIYISEYIAMRLELQNTKKFPPYYPQKYFKEHNEYRNLEKDKEEDKDKETNN